MPAATLAFSLACRATFPFSVNPLWVCLPIEQGVLKFKVCIIQSSLSLTLWSPHDYVNRCGNCSSLWLHIVLMRRELMQKSPEGGHWRGLDMILPNDVKVLSC